MTKRYHINQNTRTKEVLAKLHRNELRYADKLVLDLKEFDYDLANKLKQDIKFIKLVPKAVVHYLYRRAISQYESIIILLKRFKYVEAYSLSRNMFESLVMIRYLDKYPFEVKRWLEFDHMSVDEIDKFLENNKLVEFEKYLDQKGFGESKKLMEERKLNHVKFKHFSPKLIRDLAFEEKNNDKTLKEFDKLYSFLSKRVHAGVFSQVFNDTYQDITFWDSLRLATLVAADAVQYLMKNMPVKIDLKLANEINKKSDYIFEKYKAFAKKADLKY